MSLFSCLHHLPATPTRPHWLSCLLGQILLQLLKVIHNLTAPSCHFALVDPFVCHSPASVFGDVPSEKLIQTLLDPLDIWRTFIRLRRVNWMLLQWRPLLAASILWLRPASHVLLGWWVVVLTRAFAVCDSLVAPTVTAHNSGPSCLTSPAPQTNARRGCDSWPF